jgi:hypothetical protein
MESLEFRFGGDLFKSARSVHLDGRQSTSQDVLVGVLDFADFSFRFLAVFS